jgi:glycosyltransferase involved in cell wall biosynthesis
LWFKRTRDFKLGADLQERITKSGVLTWFCNRGTTELWRAIRQADVVHVQNPCPDVVLMARLMGKPVLINVINHCRGGRSLHERLWKLCLRLGQRRLYISDFVRRTWEQSDRPWRNSQVVFPVCDLAPLEPLPVEQRRGFVFVGRWIENKGLEILVEAYAKSGLDPNWWPLRLLGDGPLRPRVEALTKKLGLDQVLMPGFTSEHEKWQAIRGSRFAVIPPHTKEDFGLVAIEARHLGVPCVISRDGGLPEAAGVHSILCEPGSVEDLARALKKAASMSLQDYEAMAFNTRRSLQDTITAPSFCRDHYLELAGYKRNESHV